MNPENNPNIKKTDSDLISLFIAGSMSRAEFKGLLVTLLRLAEEANKALGGSSLEIGEITEAEVNGGVLHQVWVHGDIRLPADEADGVDLLT